MKAFFSSAIYLPVHPHHSNHHSCLPIARHFFSDLIGTQETKKEERAADVRRKSHSSSSVRKLAGEAKCRGRNKETKLVLRVYSPFHCTLHKYRSLLKHSHTQQFFGLLHAREYVMCSRIEKGTLNCMNLFN